MERERERVWGEGCGGVVRGEGRVANATSEDRITSACKSTLTLSACKKMITYFTLLFYKLILNSKRDKMK